jgi:hypothetical protein
MASNKRLKAFVRYDGTGRVVPSSVILQRNKPKVGNYKEIDAYECCNPTTTTTTTAGPTTTTTTTVASTEFTRGYWLTEEDACNTTTFGNLTFYSANPTVTSGITIFSDAGLTTPVTQGYVVSQGMTRYAVGEGGLLSVLVCP